MRAEVLADYRTRIADRTLITLSVISIERILDERLRLLEALHAVCDKGAEDAWPKIQAAIEYANEPIP